MCLIVCLFHGEGEHERGLEEGMVRGQASDADQRKQHQNVH